VSNAEKARNRVYDRLYKLSRYGWVFPVGFEQNLKLWATPALFAKLANCNDKTFEEIAVPLARFNGVEG
jgi:hypothetical protein